MPDVAAVVIGRNEGARLMACLASLEGQIARLVYVDSGSGDGSFEAAEAQGAEVVRLDPARPFTAARARNEGVARLRRTSPPAFVQFIDGDCEIAPGWVARARAAFEGHPDLAVVCGRRRETAPEASVYNRVIDREWDTPVGPATACGGDALVRRVAFEEVEGFNPALIAGEEPELCVRLRTAGWRIERIDAEMTRHDAAITRLPQWWRRARRAGYAYALGAALHGGAPERHRVAERRRALMWGLALPLAALLLALAVSPWALLVLLAYPAQIARLWHRDGDLAHAALLVLGKFAEARGVVQYLVDASRGHTGAIIEYK